MSDFPRGWTLTAQTPTGNQTSITIPGTPGVVHVLDTIDGLLDNIGVVAGNEVNVVLTTSDGAFTNAILGLAVVEGTARATGSVSRSGLDLAASPGASMTVSFATGLAGILETLTVQGHDI